MDEQNTSEWLKDSQSFDSIARLYDEYRPDYPQELANRIIQLSGLPQGGRILEIGSGTGKATCLFAGRGYPIHCVEPGRNLAALAARNLQSYPLVTFEIARFEGSKARQEDFDLVISAQAFHWIAKDIGYAKVARALKPSGSMALFWNMYPGFSRKIAAELNRIYHDLVPGLDNPKTYEEETIQERLTDINQSGFFGSVTVERFPWSHTYRTKEYLGLLHTYSDHIRLSEQTCHRLYKAVGDAIDAQGGLVQRNYVAVLYIAHKRS